MGKTTKLACIVCITSGALLAQPTQLNVVNFNFGTPSVAAGTPAYDSSGSDITGWQTSSSLVGPLVTVSGVYVPTSAQYLNAGSDIGMGTGNTQALFLSPTATDSTGTYQQILGDQIVPGVTYQLTVAVGARDNGENFAGYVISLGADNSVLGSVSGLTLPSGISGAFEDVSLTYTATDADSGFLTISLAAGINNDLGSVDFTNVRLEAVPEASTWAAIGFAGLVGASVAWRQRRAITA